MIALMHYCTVAQQHGLTMNGALKVYRAAGGKARRQVFGLCWRATTDQGAAAQLAERTAAA